MNRVISHTSSSMSCRRMYVSPLCVPSFTYRWSAPGHLSSTLVTSCSAPARPKRIGIRKPDSLRHVTLGPEDISPQAEEESSRLQGRCSYL